MDEERSFIDPVQDDKALTVGDARISLDEDLLGAAEATGAANVTAATLLRIWSHSPMRVQRRLLALVRYTDKPGR